MTDVPVAPADLVHALWICAWVFGGTIVAVAGAFTTLAWWVIRTQRRDTAIARNQCREDNRALQEKLDSQAELHNGHVLKFVEAFNLMRDAIKSLRREVLGAEEETSSDLHAVVEDRPLRQLPVDYFDR
jgi:hypothetical protein